MKLIDVKTNHNNNLCIIDENDVYETLVFIMLNERHTLRLFLSLLRVMTFETMKKNRNSACSLRVDGRCDDEKLVESFNGSTLSCFDRSSFENIKKKLSSHERSIIQIAASVYWRISKINVIELK